MDKPTKPTNLMPRSFGGLKENYSTSLQQNGVEPNVPVIYHGRNFNYEKNAIGQELDYCEKIVDFVNGLPIGKIISTDSNNKLVYENLSTVGKTGNYNDLTNKPTIPSVDNLANKDLSNLTTTGNNKILPTQTGNNGKYLTTNGSVPSWTDFTGANKDLSNLSDIGDSRLHALKSYADNGELLTDAEGLADVTNYAHSTFDESKFTVVGSPIITSDGIASGFSQQGSLYVNKNLTNANIIIIKMCTSFSSLNSTEGILCTKTSNFLSRSGDAIRITNDGGATNMIYSKPIETNTNYYITLTINKIAGKTILDVVDKNGTSMNNAVNEGNWLVEFDTDNNMTLGIANHAITSGSAWLPLINGSIDLKAFKIYVDGVEVFSGNKTGVDTIKPNNYTVVGTPTITADGVASGFSSSNYLRTPTIDFSKPFEIIFEEKFITRPTGLYSNLLNIQGMTSGNNIGYYIQAKLASDSFAGIFNMIVNNTIHWEFIKFLWTGEQYKIYLKENANADWVLRSTYDSTIPPSTANNTTTAILVAGYNQNSVYSADGSIDLNAFKIYVDGNLVYQPCLKIPYTEAKTGSKIVDSIYRDRVNDMAEQYGYANYYTLDEENGNFTLPMGEVYGMIGHNSSSIDTLETGKADTDLSNINPTQTAKNTILGWGMPDYANGVEITAQPFVAPSAGYIVGHAYRAGTTATKAYINSVEIGHEENDYIDIQMLMNTGDEYSDNANSRELTFLPLMGV